MNWQMILRLALRILAILLAHQPTEADKEILADLTSEIAKATRTPRSKSNSEPAKSDTKTV
jgi:hypothetical protein